MSIETTKKQEAPRSHENDLLHSNEELGELAARFCYAAAVLPSPIIQEVLDLFENISDNHRTGERMRGLIPYMRKLDWNWRKRRRRSKAVSL